MQSDTQGVVEEQLLLLRRRKERMMHELLQVLDAEFQDTFAKLAPGGRAKLVGEDSAAQKLQGSASASPFLFGSNELLLGACLLDAAQIFLRREEGGDEVVGVDVAAAFHSQTPEDPAGPLASERKMNQLSGGLQWPRE